MELTVQMKAWLVKEMGVDVDASDDVFKAAAGKAVAEGKLSVSKLTELTTTKADESANEVIGLLQGVGTALKELQSTIKQPGSDEDDDEETVEEKAARIVAEKAASEKAELDATTKAVADKEAADAEAARKSRKPSALEKMVVGSGGGMGGGWSPDESGKDFDVRVKEAAESYSTEKSALSYPSHNEKGAPHAFAGQPVLDYSEPGKGRPIHEGSDLEKAVAGAWCKFEISSQTKRSKTLAFMALPQHDKELLCYAMEKMNWGGSTTGEDLADIKDRKLSPSEQKALIDDATSGGLEAAPIVFDDQVIQTPLLMGELYPLVNTIPLDRGRRIEGVATGTVTGGWGGVDDSAIALFNTASYVSAFDTTIYRWEGAIRVGLDFLGDTPIDFGQHISSQYGERLLEDLDDVIATGNGTTQPEGIMNKSGTTSVAFGGTTTLGNYESLRFSVAKPEHKANLKSTAVFCGTETSYQRARAIPVGASDARRLGGMNYDSYSWMERPYKINESLTNAQLFYAILGRYRMYRRRGLSIRTSTEGDTLIRNNEMLMVAMARFGGQAERGAVAGVTTTAPV